MISKSAQWNNQNILNAYFKSLQVSKEVLEVTEAYSKLLKEHPSLTISYERFLEVAKGYFDIGNNPSGKKKFNLHLIPRKDINK